jgi:hypothetical protein
MKALRSVHVEAKEVQCVSAEFKREIVQAVQRTRLKDFR